MRTHRRLKVYTRVLKIFSSACGQRVVANIVPYPS